VSGRLIAIAIALAVSAFAEIRYDTEALNQRQSNAAAGQLADPSAPESDAPAIITAAVSTSATAQTVPVIESKRQVRPAPSISTVSLRLLDVVNSSSDKPRFIPLLI
jgi:hypothetical protein